MPAPCRALRSTLGNSMTVATLGLLPPPKKGSLPFPAFSLLKFAGEHADSFFSWQGYMEGGCLSGIRAANEILADIRAGRI